MSLWQKSMISLARSRRVTEFVHGCRLTRPFSRQFVGGDDPEGGVERARDLLGQGLTSSMFYLGEYVETREMVEENMNALLEAVPLTARAGLDLHVSVDPTQVGSMISWDMCRENVERLARAMADQETRKRRVLMLDMEDSSVTRPTFDLYYDLVAKGLPAAVTIQAYLFRTIEDAVRLVDGGAFVRLVKGAFAEPGDIAHTTPRARDAAYRQIIDILFSAQARKNGVYPALGTHDHDMVAYADAVARENGWSRDQWEVEMLLGVRGDFQRRLVRDGFNVRLYLPFGRHWWPYSIRRIGETPRNLGFVLRAMIGG